jgi:hypothetical protein
MNAAAITQDRPFEVSPKTKARLTGVFFLLTVIGGIVAEGFISASLVVAGDAAATAKNILGNESLFRAGFAIYLIEMVCQVVMTVLFYDLLKPVSRTVARISLFLNIAGIVIKTISRLFFIVPLLILGDVPYLSVFTAEQVQAMALLSLGVNTEGPVIGLVFFGFAGLLEAYLILRSNFLPRFLGAIGIVASLGWLFFLYPPLAYRMFPFIVGVGLLGALLQILWLTVFGVNEERWRQQAAASANSIWR